MGCLCHNPFLPAMVTESDYEDAGKTEMISVSHWQNCPEATKGKKGLKVVIANCYSDKNKYLV